MVQSKKHYTDYLIEINGVRYPRCATCNDPIIHPNDGNFVADNFMQDGKRVGSVNWRFTHKGIACTPREGEWYSLTAIMQSGMPYTRLDRNGCFRFVDSETQLALSATFVRLFAVIPQKRLPHSNAMENDIPTWGGVYLVKCLDRYKIGKAQNIRFRVSALATAAPYDLEYIHGIQTRQATELERQLHNRFAAKRVRGEWFELSAEDVSYITSL